MRNFIGVDLGGTNIRAAIVSEDGTIKCMKKSESHPERGAEAVMETMISLIESLDGYEECEGIGMGIPGPIDTINGKIIVSTNLPKLIGFPIAEYIENQARRDLKLVKPQELLFAFNEEKQTGKTRNDSGTDDTKQTEDQNTDGKTKN